MAEKKPYRAPRLHRRDELSKVTEAQPPITGRLSG